MVIEERRWTDAHTRRATASLPACVQPGLVHLNSAGCSLPSQSTLDAVQAYLTREATVGGYETFDAEAVALRLPYTALAALLNCRPDELAIVSSATAAWQQVVYGLAWAWRAGDRVLVSVAEYGSNVIALLQLARRTGISIEVIPETSAGDVDLAALQEALARGPRTPVLVALSHVPTSSGRVYDAAGVGALCRAAGVPFLLDACQSVGQLPVDMAQIGCDFASGTGRKYLRGPRGSGFLFCRSDALARFEPAVLDNTGARWVAHGEYELQPDARRFESYEMCYAAKVGLGVAAQECLDLGIRRIWARVQQLAAALRAGLAGVPGVALHDHGAALCGLVSFTIAGLTADQVQQALAARHINVSVSRTGSSRYDFEQRGLAEVVRASVHYYVTEDQLQCCVEVVAETAAATAAQDGSRALSHQISSD